jgi:pimeloyl-ACP methyl ester carboxylesterase
VTHRSSQAKRSDAPGRTIRLPDGRRLGYAEWGDQDGQPVFYFHGTPGSRLERYPSTPLLVSLGIRLITVDRPGYGLSTFQPRRRLLDWPADVVELAEALGIGRFVAVGVSGGGPHAMACAYAIPDRLSGVVIASSPCPLDSWSCMKGMSLLQRAAFRLAYLSPELLRPFLWWQGNPGRDSEAFTMAGYERLPRADQLILARADVRAMLTGDFAESARRGVHAYAHDVSLLARPWGFRLKHIRIPISLWHGQADTIVPVHMSRHLAAAIPRCAAEFVPDAGHFLVLDHLPDMLRALVSKPVENGAALFRLPVSSVGSGKR